MHHRDKHANSSLMNSTSTDMTGLPLAAAEETTTSGQDVLGNFQPSTSFFNDLPTLLDSSKETPQCPSIKKKKANMGTKKRKGSTGTSPSSTVKKKARTSSERTATDNTNVVPLSPIIQSEPDARSSVKCPKAPEVAASASAGSCKHGKTKRSGNKKSEEAEYKSLAEAAVTSLVANATVTKKSGAIEKVDTSTAHIKALTGNNWVCASSSISTGSAAPCTTSSGVSVGSKSSASNNASKGRRPALTADERARQNRDRNREHARNTRLRKKAYVDELKQTLVEVVAEREQAELEERQLIQREAEQKQVRLRVIEEFLMLRGSNETNAARWSAILLDDFSLILPVTQYREMVRPSATIFEQKLIGVSDCMTDAGLRSAFLRNLHEESFLEYKCDSNSLIMDKCIGIVDWVACAVRTGISVQGTLRAEFCPASNKLVSAKMIFDTGAFQSLAQQSSPRNLSANDASGSNNIRVDSVEIPRLVGSVSTTSNRLGSTAGLGKGEVSSDESLSDSQSANGKDTSNDSI
jgi:hypothetical protein